MKSRTKKNIIKKVVKIAVFALSAMLFLGCQMESYAYTEEEIEAAKAWLSAHGYSPDAGGASQAYQDYLNGKFDAPQQNPQPDTQTPDGTTPGETQTPDGTTPDQEGTTPDEATNPDGTTQEETPNVDDRNENDTSQGKGETSEGESDGKGDDGSSKGEKGDEEDSKSENNQNGSGTGTNSTTPQLNPSNAAGNGQGSSVMSTQEQELLLEALEQFVEENGSIESMGSTREDSMSENDISENSISSDNLEEQEENKDEFVPVSSNTNDEKQRENQNALYIWIIASVAAVAVLGVICFFVLRKK